MADHPNEQLKECPNCICNRCKKDELQKIVEEKLRRCPFCGGKPYVSWHPFLDGITIYCPGNELRNCSTNKYFSSWRAKSQKELIDQVINHWNTRL